MLSTVWSRERYCGQGVSFILKVIKKKPSGGGREEEGVGGYGSLISLGTQEKLKS